MACSGLHCSGCGVGISVPPIAFAYVFGAAWIAEHLAAVAVTSAVCGALAVAAVVALMRWQDRRQARFAAQASIWIARAEALPPPEIHLPVSDYGIRERLTDSGFRTLGAESGRLELEPRALHLHFHGLPDAEQAAVIRHAINGGTQ